ncbi:MAG: hypothetical protein J6W96_02880 [Alphaproteobacteria bacterium]|nr:hypothetical protein [Alphaproteobacteria bacterium]
MSEFKERSLIFKCVYVIFRIVTFPVYFVLFFFKHFFLLLLLLLLLLGFAIYYPHSQGVKFDELPAWYKNKIFSAQREVIVKAGETGMLQYVPQKIINNAKKMEDDAREADMPKGDFYNNKVERDTVSEETKAQLKQRTGFKKKSQVYTPQEEQLPKEEVAETVKDDETSAATDEVHDDLNSEDVKENPVLIQSHSESDNEAELDLL